MTGKDPLVPILDVSPCAGGFDFGACLPNEDETFWVPTMHYEYWPRVWETPSWNWEPHFRRFPWW